MPLEKQLTSLEPSQKLKKLGVKQESLFYWWSDGYTYFKTEYGKPQVGVPAIEICSAFTVAELGEFIKDIVPLPERLGSGEWMFTIPRTINNEYADTEADARAKMLIYLIENKLIDLNK